MAILNFIKPDKVVLIESDDYVGEFEFRPLEQGYGLTVGNALRRVLLSSLEGFAITSFKIRFFCGCSNITISSGFFCNLDILNLTS